jgi:GT2 family glycosyltransferase
VSRALVQSKYPGVRWLAGLRKGPAANRNHGARHARGEWLVFVDDDCIPEPGWLAGYAAAMAANPGVSVFEGRTFADRPRRTMAETAPVNESGGYLWSCNFAVARTLFHAMGGFDERFPYAAMEDVDFYRRLTLRGESIVFVPDAAVCHPWRPVNGWTGFKRHQESTMIYLSIHPVEIKRLSPEYYLRGAFRSAFKRALPGLVQFRGAGLGSEMLQFLSCVQMAWKVMFWRNAPGAAPAVPEVQAAKRAAGSRP